MKEKKRSKTAEAAAAARAYHLFKDGPLVFEDPYAVHLTSRIWRMIIKNRPLRWLVFEKALHVMLPVGGEILARARYAEELLDKAIKNGMDQYVILGAGLDSFALRQEGLASTFQIYELDHPASQESKKKRLRELKLDLPDNLELVPINFESESLADGLKRSSYSNERRAFFSWLGTIPYLTRDAIFQTLRSVASIAASGSEIVFDYRISKEFIAPADLPSVEAVDRFVRRRGEPFLSALDPHTFPQDVCGLGFEMIEQLSPEQQLERYFAGRNDNFRPYASGYFAHFCIRA